MKIAKGIIIKPRINIPKTAGPSPQS